MSSLFLHNKPTSGTNTLSKTPIRVWLFDSSVGLKNPVDVQPPSRVPLYYGKELCF